MATANFGSTIFNRYYVLEDDELEDGYAVEEIENRLQEIKDTLVYRKDNEIGHITCVSRCFEFCGRVFDVEISVNVKCGYYEGAYFDGELHIEGSEYRNIEDAVSVSEDILADGLYHVYDGCRYNSIVAIQHKNFAKRLENECNRLMADIESVLEECTSQYVCVGRFSNGEAMYQRISNF